MEVDQVDPTAATAAPLTLDSGSLLLNEVRALRCHNKELPLPRAVFSRLLAFLDAHQARTLEGALNLLDKKRVTKFLSPNDARSCYLVESTRTNVSGDRFPAMGIRHLVRRNAIGYVVFTDGPGHCSCAAYKEALMCAVHDEPVPSTVLDLPWRVEPMPGVAAEGVGAGAGAGTAAASTGDTGYDSEELGRAVSSRTLGQSGRVCQHLLAAYLADVIGTPGPTVSSTAVSTFGYEGAVEKERQQQAAAAAVAGGGAGGGSGGGAGAWAGASSSSGSGRHGAPSPQAVAAAVHPQLPVYPVVRARNEHEWLRMLTR